MDNKEIITPPVDQPINTHRRVFMGTLASVGTCVSLSLGAAEVHFANDARIEKAQLSNIKIRVNGVSHELMVEPRVTLLDALRDHLHFTGTKKGCDRGQCGACTVLVDDRRINSCLTLAVMHDGASVVTVEGLALNDEPNSLQAAFMEFDAFQCGYCTPGQLCSATAMIDEARAKTASAVTLDVRNLASDSLSHAEIRERMSGNICRCGAYPNIIAAIRDVAARSV